MGAGQRHTKRAVEKAARDEPTRRQKRGKAFGRTENSPFYSARAFYYRDGFSPYQKRTLGKLSRSSVPKLGGRKEVREGEITDGKIRREERET